ncbi:hypothetical protein [Niallia sp. NCCP-28]|nr:hypothetical protein [Niallia sp. NCCP-28]GKU82282.1 hypothetical protein NCCP28_16780 [Niallia sp. NCCP-28]
MKNKKNNQKQESANVEFGIEFGDVNANKFYDVQANKKLEAYKGPKK